MTHVNAYYGAVEEAKQVVAEAEGKLVAALKALHEHPDYVEPEEVVEHEYEVAPDEASDQKEAAAEAVEAPVEPEAKPEDKVEVSSTATVDEPLKVEVK